MVNSFKLTIFIILLFVTKSDTSNVTSINNQVDDCSLNNHFLQFTKSNFNMSITSEQYRLNNTIINNLQEIQINKLNHIENVTEHFDNLKNSIKVVINSPLGRHEVENMTHYYFFCLHDITSILSLIGFAYLLWHGKGKKDNHVIIGRICGVVLLIAVISGFILIFSRTKGDDALVHTTPFDLNRALFLNQGITVVGLIFNAFLFQRWIKSSLFSLFLVFYHSFSFVMGLKALKYLLGAIFPNFFGIRAESKYFQEISTELLLLITIPELIIDTILIIKHHNYFRNEGSSSGKGLSQNNGWLWQNHHSMCIIFMIYMAMPGIFYTFIHDKYWVFTKPIESIVVRLGFCLTVQMVFLSWNIKYVKDGLFTIKEATD